MTCDELRREAGGLAALAADDPERVAAFGHARTCAACAAALREGERLVALIDALPPEPAPHSDALRRAAAPVLDGMPRVPARTALPLAAAVAAALVAVAARSRSHELRDWAAAAALAAVAAGIAALVGRGARWGTAVAAAAAASLLFALAGGSGGLLDAGEGLKCAATELAAAAGPVLAAISAWRGGLATPGRLAAAAAAGALAGQAALEVACPVAGAVTHLVVFHVGAVLAAAVLGGLCSLAVASSRSE